MKTGTDVVSIEEVAGRLGVNRSTVYAGMESGQIPCIKVGRRVLIPRSAFELMMGLGQRGMAEAVKAPPVDVEQITRQIKRELLEVQRRAIDTQLGPELMERQSGGR